jgi:cytochrome c556
MRKFHRTFVTLIAAAGILLAAGAKLDAQSSGDFLPQFTIAELMDSIVMPSADVVWGAIVYEGDTVTGPKTDEDWQKVRWSAVELAESANLLMVPGRAANLPGAVAGEGELAPEEIVKRIDEQRASWVAFAHVLHEAAMESVRAIDAKDPEAVSNAGGTIDAACESCHRAFWYPEQN